MKPTTTRHILLTGDGDVFEAVLDEQTGALLRLHWPDGEPDPERMARDRELNQWLDDLVRDFLHRRAHNL
jgi:hypothetical protein